MPIDKLDLWKKASSIRKKLEEDDASPIDLFSLVNSIPELTLVLYPMGKNLSGMCIRGKNNCLIAINSTMSLGRQRFSLAHELYHLYYDQQLETIICGTAIGGGTEVERKADLFASYLLMPPHALSQRINSFKVNNTDHLSIKEVVALEQHFGVSRQAILLRLEEEKELTAKQTESMKYGVIGSASRLGYDDTLYKPLPVNKQYNTYGNYIKKAGELLEKNLISSGKYDELLLAAFRSDIVYGEENNGGELSD